MADEYKPDLGLNDGLSDPRVAEILNVFVKYTSLDFSEKVSISEEGDEIDAIAIGLNALGEELKFKHEQEQEYRKQLEGYSTQLESKNKELEQFVYITSHDLQEPLRNVTSFTEIIDTNFKESLPEEVSQMFIYMHQSVNRMSLLIRDLLTYLRTGNQGIKEKADLNTFLQSSLDFHKNAIRDSKAVIDADPLPEVSVLRRQVPVLFDNIISNCIKYRKENVPLKIEIRHKELKNLHRISFTDNGIGIAEIYHEKIFKIFQRLHNAERRMQDLERKAPFSRMPITNANSLREWCRSGPRT